MVQVKRGVVGKTVIGEDLCGLAAGAKVTLGQNQFLEMPI